MLHRIAVVKVQGGPFSDPNPASSSRPHASEPKQFTSTNVEDDVFGGSFDISPPRSTEATLQYSLGDSQASDLKAHKLVFKEVVGKLVKKVKELEDKLKRKKRKFVMTEYDIQEEEEQDVDPLIKLAKAAATAADDLVVPIGGSNEDAIPLGSSIPSDAFAGGSASPPDVTTGPTDAPSDKGKSPMLEEKPPVRERSSDRADAGKRKSMSKKQRKDKGCVGVENINNDADWNEIMGQVHVTRTFLTDLLGTCCELRTTLQRGCSYYLLKGEQGWTMKHVRSFSDDQLKDEFDKIRHAVANLQSQHLRRSFKRQGTDFEQPDSKKSKSTEPQKTSVPVASRPSSAGVTPDVHQLPFVNTSPATPLHSPKASSYPDCFHCDTFKINIVAPKPHILFFSYTSITRTSGPRKETNPLLRKAFGRKGVSSFSLYIPIEAEDPDVRLGSMSSTGKTFSASLLLGDLDTSFTNLPRTDLMIIYGRVMQFYQDTEATGVGLVLWGDLKVLIDSPEVNDGSDV
ncbi:hypothetical protein Tco_0963875 [Tanacetum coccineum]